MIVIKQQQKLTIHLEEVELPADSNQQICERLKSECIDGPEWLPVITFVLGTITTGFLKAIGSQIWSNIKKVFAKTDVDPPGVKVKFNYEGVEIEARVKSNNLKVIKQALDNLGYLVAQIDSSREGKINFVWIVENKWQKK